MSYKPVNSFSTRISAVTPEHRAFFSGDFQAKSGELLEVVGKARAGIQRLIYTIVEKNQTTQSEKVRAHLECAKQPYEDSVQVLEDAMENYEENWQTTLDDLIEKRDRMFTFIDLMCRADIKEMAEMYEQLGELSGEELESEILSALEEESVP